MAARAAYSKHRATARGSKGHTQASSRCAPLLSQPTPCLPCHSQRLPLEWPHTHFQEAPHAALSRLPPGPWLPEEQPQLRCAWPLPPPTGLIMEGGVTWGSEIMGGGHRRTLALASAFPAFLRPTAYLPICRDSRHSLNNTGAPKSQVPGWQGEVGGTHRPYGQTPAVPVQGRDGV